jgi:GNAT superfamily N-acetyltransferase
MALRDSVGWHGVNDIAVVEQALAAVVHAVVAEDTDTGKAVGSALLLGDNVSFYYVKDVNVHPNWQSKQVGTALMRSLIDWVEANGPDGAMVTLFTGEVLKGFYGQFGFAPGYGMMRTIHRPQN